MSGTSTAADSRASSAPPRSAAVARRGLAARVTWRHAAVWIALAVLAVVVTLIVVDNFVLVEVRLPGAEVRTRLGWVVVSSAVVGLVVGWVLGRWSRPAISVSRRARPDEA